MWRLFEASSKTNMQISRNKWAWDFTNFDDGFAAVVTGLKRTFANMRRTMTIPGVSPAGDTGKTPLPFDVYRAVECQAMPFSEGGECTSAGENGSLFPGPNQSDRLLAALLQQRITSVREWPAMAH